MSGLVCDSALLRILQYPNNSIRHLERHVFLSLDIIEFLSPSTAPSPLYGPLHEFSSRVHFHSYRFALFGTPGASLSRGHMAARSDVSSGLAIHLGARFGDPHDVLASMNVGDGFAVIFNQFVSTTLN